MHTTVWAVRARCDLFRQILSRLDMFRRTTITWYPAYIKDSPRVCRWRCLIGAAVGVTGIRRAGRQTGAVDVPRKAIGTVINNTPFAMAQFLYWLCAHSMRLQVAE